MRVPSVCKPCLLLAVTFLPWLSWAGNFTVGIVGAGLSGVYAATVLSSIGVEYQILEASGRAGGRIWTHYFDHDAWQRSQPGQPAYYDYFVSSCVTLGLPQMTELLGHGSNENTEYSLHGETHRKQDRLACPVSQQTRKRLWTSAPFSLRFDTG